MNNLYYINYSWSNTNSFKNINEVKKNTINNFALEFGIIPNFHHFDDSNLSKHNEYSTTHGAENGIKNPIVKVDYDNSWCIKTFLFI